MPYHRTIPSTPAEAALTRYIRAGIVGSIVIHISLWGALNHKHPPPPLESFSVDFIPALPDRPEPKAPPPAIVSPPEKTSGTPPETAFRSDTDNVVVREQIKRGDDPNAGAALGAPAEPAPKAAAKPAKEAPPRRAPAPKAAPEKIERPQPLKALSLDSATILKDLAPTAAKSDRSRDLTAAILDSGASGVSNDYRAFSRPSGSGAAIVGLRGSNDYLPNLPDGDITFLNTKANIFAVFVRRVATQVFGQLRRSGWESLSAGDVNTIRGYATVRATLNPKGELIDVQLIGESGSRRFDDIVAQAARAGARDPHPPKGAEAADGNIRFIFQSKSWVRLSADPRGPGFGERRWILLGTGLE